MSQIDLKVGVEEVHNITFKMNRMTGKYTVTVDGNLLKTKGGRQYIIGSKEVNFEVGEKEHHKISISWEVPVFGGFRQWDAKVYIDGKLFQTCKI